MIAHNRIVDALQGAGYATKPAHGYTMAQCPAHGDRSPSLSIRQINDRARVKCFSGCHDEDILDALGLTVKDLFDNPKGSTYEYTDAMGRPERTVTRTPEKKFFQQGQAKAEPGEKVLTLPYQLPKISDAICNGTTIYLVEGEADVHAAESQGLVATTYPGGVGMIGNADFSHLYGANVIAVRDRDEPGMKWLETVQAALDRNTATIYYQEPAEGCKDLTDHIMSGHSMYMLEPAPILDYTEPVEVPTGVDREQYLLEMTRQYTTAKARKAVQERIKEEEKSALGYETADEEWSMNSVSAFNSNESVRPEAWGRTDGEHLLYRGKSHALIADGGTGKTLVALDAARWFAERGEDVLFIDYEDTGNTAATRLKLLGTSQEATERIIYVSGSGHLNDNFKTLTRRKWGLVIIDSVDESVISVTGDTNSPNDNGAVKLWNHQFVFPFLSAGATVVMIDHISKGKEASKGHARGASAKKDILTGAQLFLDQISPIAPGKNGTLRARVEKDRPGGLKSFMDEASAVADFNVKSQGEKVARVFIDPPKPPAPVEDKSDLIKRSLVIEVEATPGLKSTDYQRTVTGSTEDKRKAWSALVGAGHLHQDREGNEVTWTVTSTGRSFYLP